MKVGDYVRTNRGTIDRFVVSHKDDTYDYTWYSFEERGNITNPENYVIKSSPNIIDLIEVGDYVNGHLVICKMYEDEKDIPTIVKCVGDYYFKEEDIKSIVTKEQFNSMEYKLNNMDKE